MGENKSRPNKKISLKLFCFRRLRCRIFRFIGNGAGIFEVFGFLESLSAACDI